MPVDGRPERPRDLLQSPGMLAFGLFEEAYREIGNLQQYALSGGDTRENGGGSPFLGILGRMLGALYHQTNYPYRDRLRELLERHQRG